MAGPAEAVEMGAMVGAEDVEACVAVAASGLPDESKEDRPPTKRRGQVAFAEEDGGRRAGEDDHTADAGQKELEALGTGSRGVRSGPGVSLALSRSLKIFAWIYVYSALVELFTVVAVFLRAKIQGQVLSRISVSIIYSVGRGASMILMGGMTAAFSLAAGHHFSKAGNPPPEDGGDKRHVGKHVEKGVIYLCPLFNSLGLTNMFGAILALINTAILYPEISAVVAMSLVVVAVVWVLGYPIFMHWYRRSEWSQQRQSKGLNVRGILVATREERSRIPPFIRFWLRQVIGRPELQKDGETSGGGETTSVWDSLQGMMTGGSRPRPQVPEIHVGEAYANVNFSDVQIHLLRLLPNAMWQCTNLVFMRVYTSSLLLMTDLIVGSTWGALLRSFVDVIRYCIVFTLIVAGAYLFEAAVHDRHRSDIQNLIKAFLTLQAMFRRLSFMFTLTATIELISTCVGLVQLYDAS